jgi:hypothetical protein
VVESARQVETDFLVWEENADIVDLFLKVQTQWNITHGGVVGLNYGAVEFCLKIYKVKDRQQVFDGLRVMEMAALSILNTREDKK